MLEKMLNRPMDEKDFARVGYIAYHLEINNKPTVSPEVINSIIEFYESFQVYQNRLEARKQASYRPVSAIDNWSVNPDKISKL